MLVKGVNNRSLASVMDMLVVHNKRHVKEKIYCKKTYNGQWTIRSMDKPCLPYVCMPDFQHYALESDKDQNMQLFIFSITFKESTAGAKYRIKRTRSYSIRLFHKSKLS